MRRWALVAIVLAAVLVLPAICGCGEPGHIEATTGAGNTAYSIGFQFKVPAATDISSALTSAVQAFAPEVPQPAPATVQAQPAPAPAPVPTPVVAEPQPEPDPCPEPQRDPVPS